MLKTETAELRRLLEDKDRQTARIDARSLPIIGFGIVLSGVPETLAKIPWHLGWLLPAFGVFAAVVVADLLADPAVVPFPGTTGEQVRRQSLAYGAPGIALLHIELAARGERSWDRAHDWLAYATHRPVASGPDTHLFYGAPAVAHALACAAEAKPGSYGSALESLDTAIRADLRARLDAAHARIDAGELTALAEFDVIRGLAGVGSYLLRRDGGGDFTRDLLTYLVCQVTPPVTMHSGSSGAARQERQAPSCPCSLPQGPWRLGGQGRPQAVGQAMRSTLGARGTAPHDARHHWR